MSDEEQKPPTPPETVPAVEPAPPATPAKAAADKPASSTPAEPLSGEVSRTDSPSAGASAAPAAPKPAAPAAPKPPAPAAAAPGAAAPKPAAAAKPAPKPAAEHPPKVAPPAGPTEPPPPADKPVPAFITDLQNALPGAVTLVSFFVGDWTVVVHAARLHDVARHLRDAAGAAFDFCSDVTATDWPPRTAERFDVVYALYSTAHRHRVRVKTRVSETTPLASVTDLWPAANWLEREVYDMFGVNFTGHPDRRRILMPDDWQGYPQRKDYPLEGPGELLLENPQEWLKLKQTREQADIE